MKLHHIPNLITSLRIAMVLPIGWLLIDRQFVIVLMLFAIAGLTDALDGFLARYFNWYSWLGGILDPLADKVLLLVTFIALGWLKLLPNWLIVAVIVRDVVIVCGFIIYQLRISQVEPDPLSISKVNTFFQITLVLAVLLTEIGLDVSSQILGVLIFSVLVTTLSSGVSYVVVWSRKALIERRGNKI